MSQQTWTLGVIVVALYIAYWYSNGSKDDGPSTAPDLKIATPLSHDLLDHIRYTQKMDRKLTAFVLGATGAVGKALVQTLAADNRFEKVVLFGRRPVELKADDPNYTKFENQIIDFDKLDEHKDAFKGHDIGFSTLGTTRRKSGAAGFYKVDHDYVVQTAKLAKEGGCQHLHLVSSAGANKNAFFLYPKTKGEVEAELTEMDFPRLSIYRPGLLLVDGSREDSRTVEAVLQGVFKPLDRLRWFSVDVPLFAKVMVANCFRESPSKYELLDNGALNKFGKQIESGQAPPPMADGGPSKSADSN